MLPFLDLPSARPQRKEWPPGCDRRRESQNKHLFGKVGIAFHSHEKITVIDRIFTDIQEQECGRGPWIDKIRLLLINPVAKPVDFLTFAPGSECTFMAIDRTLGMALSPTDTRLCLRDT